MGDNSQVQRLVELGLTTYEAKTYVRLIHRETYTAAELATAAGVPRQRIYDVLNGLVTRGLARDWPGQPTRYSATAPETAIERLLTVQRRALGSLEERSADLATELTSTWSVGRDENSPLDFVEVLRDAALLSDRYEELQRQARREMLTLAKAPYAMSGTNRVGLAATRRVAKAGGDVRCIYEAEALDDPVFCAEIDEFIAAGEHARIATDVPMKLFIADGVYAIFALTDPVAGALTSTNIVVEHAAMAASLRLAFEALWESSVPFEAARDRAEKSTVRFLG